MEIARVLRIVRARWLVVVAAGIVGLASGFGFTQLSSDTVLPVFEASIPVRFDPAEGQSFDDVAEQVEDEHGRAVLAADSLLSEYPGASILPDTASARLVFSAHGSSTGEALERARSLVEAYYETDPVVGGDVGDQLESLAEQASLIEEQIAELQPRLSAGERALVSAHDVLDRQIAAVEDELVILAVADAGATAEQRADNAARRESLMEVLNQLEDDKASLPTRPSETLSARDQFRVSGLQRSLEILRLDYERLFLRTVGVSTTGRIEPAGLTDLTPTPPSPLVNGLIGLVLGLVVGLFGSLGLARMRKEVWLHEDIAIAVLGEVPDRRTSDVPGPTWYDEAPGGERKEGIQALRTAIEGSLDREPAAIALVAESLATDSYHALAVDLAASFASAGRSVLLVDGDYLAPVDMTEFNVGEPSLGSVLRLPTSKSDTLVQRIDDLLEEAVHIRRDLAVMPAGIAPDSPADALAGPQFGVFIDRARSKFDVVVVSAGTSRSATSRVMVQRAGQALLALSLGKTTSSSISAYVRELHNLNIRSIGAVVVHGRRLPKRALQVMPSSVRDRAPRNIEDPAGSPVSRLSFYPSPEGSNARTSQSTSLQNLVSEIADGKRRESVSVNSSSEHDDLLGRQVLEAIEKSDPAVTYGPVAEYVVTRVEDIMTAAAGQAGLSPELVEIVVDHGFVTLEPVNGYRTAGELLAAELVWELGAESGGALADRFEAILCGRADKTYKDLDDWLTQEFFARHIERTGGAPEVWHLVSNPGAVQVLVYGRRLTRDRLTQLNVGLVRRMIDETERLLTKAHEEVDFPAIARLEERLKELHALEVTLGSLQAGSSEEARITYPWRRPDGQPQGWAPVWAEGIRPNIAPLQRLGLLALPVLSDEELDAVELTG